jgi:predicted dehydrogenase
MLAPWAGGPPRVVAARGGERAGHPGVDEWLEADLEFPGGATGSARCNMAGDGVRMPCRIVGGRGEAVAANFALPSMDDRVTITSRGGQRVERLGTRPTYTYQLEALRAHLRDGAPLPIDGDDALATMELIDSCYRAAGFRPRPRMRELQGPTAKPPGFRRSG